MVHLANVWYTERQQQNRERDAKLFGPGSASSAPTSAACQVSVVDDGHDTTDGKLSRWLAKCLYIARVSCIME